jgi:hypothetical protein
VPFSIECVNKMTGFDHLDDDSYDDDDDDDDDVYEQGR